MFYGFKNGQCVLKTPVEVQTGPDIVLVKAEADYPNIYLLELADGTIREREPPEPPKPKDEVTVIEFEEEDPATVDTLAAIAGLYELLAEMEQKGA